jgi:ABC-type polysaccharide/polyol phosphate transport system ATPase subunit
MPVAIRASELTKHYNLYRRPVDRLIEAVTRRPRHTVFPALEDVSFEIESGQTIGIIGRNGAGKSTLLKLLCGVTEASSGSLETNGSIASILELGTGFHPEFTGRDNASLNAAILGLSAAQIRRALPAIFEFSELGAFLDRPVKTYSSGMYMRLAFSVAVNVDPDILIIDEALAVGDGNFQKKCVDKIRQFQEQSKTILFCSHALYYISSICQKTLWLDHGSLMRYGSSVDVVHEYESFLLQQERHDAATHDAVKGSELSPVRFSEVTVCDRFGAPRRQFSRGDDLLVRVRVTADDPRQPIHLLVGIHRAADDLQCFAVSTHADGLLPLEGRSDYEVTVRLEAVPLLRGEYTVIAFVGDEHAMHVFDRRDVPSAFSMTGDKYEIGILSVDHKWVMESPSASELAAISSEV